MSVYDDIIQILFTLPDGRSLGDYYKTIALVGVISAQDLKEGVTFPVTNVKKYSNYDDVLVDFNASSQFALEAKAAFDQKQNTQTASQLKYLMIINQGENTLSAALNAAKAHDGRFAKVVPISRAESDIQDVADWCLTNSRFTDFVVANVDYVSALVETLNNYAYGIFRKNPNVPIASALASTTTRGYFGGKDGAAQFTQLVGIAPEKYNGQEVSDMRSNNVAFYQNVSPIEGGQTEEFGYNWIIGSRMLGGELRQRQMIIDYIKKSFGLTLLEFFNQKPIYDETGNNLLLSMANRAFRSFQTYNLIISTTNEQTGFELKVVPIRSGADSIMKTDIEAYNAKKYKLKGYYYDAIVGEKVDVDLVVDPTDYQIEQLLGEAV